jgi:TatD DNase family protein
MLIDTHCHLDLYDNPSELASELDQAGILTIIVTNLPSAFEQAYPHTRQFKHIRLALGLHPLTASDHLKERDRFKELLNSTSYIGEVGLDFSREGVKTKEIQIESFRFVLESIQNQPKLVTLHSRQAEAAVLDLLEAVALYPVIFHWYTGSLSNAKRALARGDYFSVNPAMVKTPKGKQLIAELPMDRVLTESDGPFVIMNGNPAKPYDVSSVLGYLSSVWKKSRDEAEEIIKQNFFRLIKPKV